MAYDVSVLKSEITGTLDLLPPESIQLLHEFVAFLRLRSESVELSGPHVRLGGLWKGTPEVTVEDIAEVRREMWGSFERAGSSGTRGEWRL